MKLNNSLEIYKILPQINCKNCGFPTCLAFAVAIFRGQKKLTHCPRLDHYLAGQFTVKLETQQHIEQQQELILEQLREKITRIDFAASAERLGGTLSGDKLNIKCLGRDFTVDARGNISSACHVISWITMPLLDYIISSTGATPSGKWVPLRELPSGSARDPLFNMRCIVPFKQIADMHIHLIRDVLSIFGGKRVETSFDADISMAVHLLPKVPLLISYIRAEDGIPSQLNLFFDSTAAEHLSMELLYILVTGFIIMLEKIIQRHS